MANTLPPPFNQEERVDAHNIHHKFVVVDFNTPDNCVYFGSSNLALGGEENNGDNLICIKNEDFATAFAVEVIRLVDHFHFRAKTTKPTGEEKILKLKKTSVWAKPYFNKDDIKYTDRKLFVS